MHICKLIHYRNHIRKQNRSDTQNITLNIHINKQIHEHKTNTWKQHLDKINPNTIHTPCGALQQNYPTKKPPTQQNRSICFGTKTVITDKDKVKAFNKQFTNVTLYSTNKINRHIDHIMKTLSTEEIRLTTTEVQLAISNSTNNNSTRPDGINIRHLKHLGPLAIRYHKHVQHCPEHEHNTPSLETCHNHSHSKTKQRPQH